MILSTPCLADSEFLSTGNPPKWIHEVKYVGEFPDGTLYIVCPDKYRLIISIDKDKFINLKPFKEAMLKCIKETP